ncbi:MAG: hypothetical protein L0922_00555 [Candidatus Mariimomonas ferrooxydans]
MEGWGLIRSSFTLLPESLKYTKKVILKVNIRGGLLKIPGDIYRVCDAESS